MTPEELANNELEKLKKSGKLTFPIDPFKILRDAGVHIVLKDFEKLDGIIINDEDNCTIVGINSNNSLQRQRFTAAHEYCHFIKDLNKEEGESDYIECLKRANNKIEKFANDFAGYLLMPTGELKIICEQYKNEDGYIDFESITIIAEYFGVSFHACLNRIAYDLKLIDGDTSQEALKQRMREYRVSIKRRELIENTIDSTLLSNVVSSMSFLMADINKYTGQKFLQNYIYNDNKLEGVIIDRNKLNYILADLNYNSVNSKFFMKNIDNYDVGEYIEQVAYFTYKFLVIHPFGDGNGRISRALLNWLLSKKKIPPIYIDQKCRKEYYDALSKMDSEENPVPFIMFIEKRIIHTMIELHQYLFIDEIDEEELDKEEEINGN